MFILYLRVFQYVYHFFIVFEVLILYCFWCHIFTIWHIIPFFVLFMKPAQYTFALLGLCLTVAILILGQTLIIPFVIALVLFYLIILLGGAYRKISFFGWYMPRFLSNLLSVLTFFYGMYQFWGLDVCFRVEKLNMGDLEGNYHSSKV